MGRNPGNRAGYTLVELIIGLAIAGILLALAAPSMVRSITGNQMTSTANSLFTALTYARSESIKRRFPVTVCASEDGASCSNGSWNKGWIVFVDGSQPGSVESSDILLMVGEALENNQSLSLDGTPYIQFQPSGMIMAYCHYCGANTLPISAGLNKKNDMGIGRLIAAISPIATAHAGHVNRSGFNGRYRDNGCRGKAYDHRRHNKHKCKYGKTGKHRGGGRNNKHHKDLHHGHGGNKHDQQQDRPGTDQTDNHDQGNGREQDDDLQTGTDSAHEDSGSDSENDTSHSDSNEADAGNETGNGSSGLGSENPEDDNTASTNNEEDDTRQSTTGSSQDTGTSNSASAGIDDTVTAPGSPTSSGISSSPRLFTLCDTSNPARSGRAIDISLAGRISIRHVSCQ